ncbi:Oligopeptide transport ATP-binding protein OppD [compost metagenome]
MPDLDNDTDELLRTIPGSPPDLTNPPKGDAFAARNEYAMAIDYEQEPPMFQVSETHFAKTWLLHPDAPKIPLPDAVAKRIEGYLAKEAQEND